MILRWFFSKTLRHAVAMRKHVHRILCAQRDLLKPEAVQAVGAALVTLQSAVKSGGAREVLIKQMENLETVANKWLRPYPNAAWRENVEVLLVALTVAMGIRTFFLQPFKIPTGSMQPTLYGVTSVPDFGKINLQLEDDPRVKAEIQEQIKARDALVPSSGLRRIKEWFQGISYLDMKAKVDGTLDRIEPPRGIKIFNLWQTLYIGGVAHTILFPPDYGQPTAGSLEGRAGLRVGRDSFRKGQQVVRLKVQSGDHLFVNRLTYNFRKPTRGEIIVFETTGTRIPQQDTFYIKRLVALGGERVQIGDDRHLIINGQRLPGSAPHFENVYSFDPNAPPQESHFSGHLNQKTAEPFRLPFQGPLAPLFPDASAVYEILADNYMVMGDNTLNSFDSRGWGEFSASKVIGKSFFVYWPITERFGWSHR